MQNFSWSEYKKTKNEDNNEVDTMFCMYFKKHNKNNVFVKSNTRFKIDNLYERSINKEHEQTIEDSITQKCMKKMIKNTIISNDYIVSI